MSKSVQSLNPCHPCSELPIVIYIVKKLKSSTRFFLFSLGWFILTTVLLILPGDKFPEPGLFSNIPGFDKLVHIGLFSIMVALICFWLWKKEIPIGKKTRYYILSALICVVYGVIMEFVQKYYVPNRSFDMADILADTAGCMLGVLFSIKRYKLRVEKEI